MACENITVVHAGTKTATFDPGRRILTLPIWKDMSEDIYDLFVLHEIAHAIYTPKGSKVVVNACRAVDPLHPRSAKRFINIVEDCRIERMIKVTYPGGKVAFIRGYKELVERNCFGTQYQDINDFGIIDRINIFFKTGNTDIQFSDEEMKFVQEIEKVLTFDQVIDISRRLYKYAKDERDKKHSDEQEEEDSESASQIKARQPSYDDSDDDEDDVVDPDNDSNEEEEQSDVESDYVEGDEEGTSETDPIGEKSGETKEDKEAGKAGEISEDSEDKETGKASEDPVDSITDQAWEKSQEEFIDDTAKPIQYLGIPHPRLDKIIIPHHEVHGSIRRFYDARDTKKDTQQVKYHTEEFERFKYENKPVIDWLIKEFDVYKAGDEFSRTQVGKTGVLDLNRLSQYKFTTDLMRKTAKVPTGQNHALKIFIDWSSSMMEHALGTMHQLINVAIFARKKQIPFDAYLFGTYEHHSRETLYSGGETVNRDAFDSKKDDFAFYSGFSLKQILSSEMTAMQFQDACVNLLLMASGISEGVKFNQGIMYPGLPSGYYMGGTTLHETIVSVMEMISKMTEQIVNVIFITDGEATTDHRYVISEFGECSEMKYSEEEYILRDLKTRIDYSLNENSFDTTKQFLEILKSRAGVNIIGFFIAQSDKIETELNKLCPDKDFGSLEKEFTLNNFVLIPDKGYDEFYLIQGGKHLRITLPQAPLAGTIGNSQMVTAMTERGTEQRKQRIVLTRFIKMIS